MDSRLVNVYAREADKQDRDPYGPDGGGRATVVNGRGFNLYKRFNPDAQYVTVTLANGKTYELTRTQANVYDLARTYIDGKATTMREMAAILGVAASTVWRALVKLTALGLIAYISARGHYGGTYLFSRGHNDGLERLEKAAKAKVHKWSEATKARFSRLVDSVAPYVHGRGRDSLTDWFLVTSSKGATLGREWRSDELVDIV